MVMSDYYGANCQRTIFTILPIHISLASATQIEHEPPSPPTAANIDAARCYRGSSNRSIECTSFTAEGGVAVLWQCQRCYQERQVILHSSPKKEAGLLIKKVAQGRRADLRARPCYRYFELSHATYRLLRYHQTQIQQLAWHSPQQIKQQCSLLFWQLVWPQQWWCHQILPHIRANAARKPGFKNKMQLLRLYPMYQTKLRLQRNKTVWKSIKPQSTQADYIPGHVRSPSTSIVAAWRKTNNTLLLMLWMIQSTKSFL